MVKFKRWIQELDWEEYVDYALNGMLLILALPTAIVLLPFWVIGKVWQWAWDRMDPKCRK